MLIVCNGAAKSGSTWLYNIVSHILEYQWPEPKYISLSNTKHPTIKEKYLEEFLKNENIQKRTILSKNHYSKQWHRELLLSYPDTRTIDMSRETKDVIVSSYYDYCRRHNYKGSFKKYYWSFGRIQVESLARYHQVWAPEHPQIFSTSFEQLKQNFEVEVRRIASFLSLELTDEQVEKVKQDTSLGSLRENYKNDKQYNTQENNFFRKGDIGDWKNHFDDKMLTDYQHISKNGIAKFDWMYLRHRLAQKVRYKLGQVVG